ncbi:MAG: SUMF1/EgtB/PvdO family nonheme iron enzyme [Marivibrio sp.]|uniref:formylglycine-generating enzyme family protein n=1 Tax=Marivibrio sp. TaxID=2039719 RepID=UPI0032EE0B18
MSEPRTARVPGGRLQRGSTAEEVEACVADWTGRLVDPSYAENFRDWIMKEHPRHPVLVAGFEAMVYPVDNALFADFCAETATPLPESLQVNAPADHPVWGVTLDQAEAFARWLEGRDGRPWRLPREAEWEWMARGPDGRAYPFGERFDPACCNTVESGRGETTPVDAFARNPSWCGVVDLAGNVEEWTASRYAPYPGGRFIADDLIKLVGPRYPILRGGSFLLGGDLCRGARRHGPHPGPQFRITGFRLVHDAPRAGG